VTSFPNASFHVCYAATYFSLVSIPKKNRVNALILSIIAGIGYFVMLSK